MYKVLKLFIIMLLVCPLSYSAVYEIKDSETVIYYDSDLQEHTLTKKEVEDLKKKETINLSRTELELKRIKKRFDSKITHFKNEIQKLDNNIFNIKDNLERYNEILSTLDNYREE